jgi:hypothetical protein
MSNTDPREQRNTRRALARSSRSTNPSVTPRRQKDGWLTTRARTDEAHVTVYSLHVLQKRIQQVIRRTKQGQSATVQDLESIRNAMLALWHDAHRLTPPGIPLSYEEFQGEIRPRRLKPE